MKFKALNLKFSFRFKVKYAIYSYSSNSRLQTAIVKEGLTKSLGRVWQWALSLAHTTERGQYKAGQFASLGPTEARPHHGF